MQQLGCAVNNTATERQILHNRTYIRYLEIKFRGGKQSVGARAGGGEWGVSV